MATTRTREGAARPKATKGAAAPKARTTRKAAEGARPKLGSSHTTRRTTSAAAGAPRGAAPRAGASARAAAPRGASRAAVVTEATPAPKRGPGPRGPRPTPDEGASREARERALAVAAAGLEKKALDVEIIDVVGRSDYADYLVLMTGNSDRHVASIVQSVEEDARKKGSRALSVEGMPAANWVLIDLADVVVHVFQEEARGLYDIDGLWMDAKRVPPPADGPPGANGRR